MRTCAAWHGLSFQLETVDLDVDVRSDNDSDDLIGALVDLTMTIDFNEEEIDTEVATVLKL